MQGVRSTASLLVAIVTSLLIGLLLAAAPGIPGLPWPMPAAAITGVTPVEVGRSSSALYSIFRTAAACLRFHRWES